MKSPPSPLCHQKEWELILFPLPQVSFPFDCLSLLLAWCYYWHGFLAFIIHFYAAIFSLGIVIVGEFILSRCLCVIDLWVADLALHPLLRADLAVDKVTYSQMIDIFIRRGECFKTLSADIYLERGIFPPNTRRAQTHPSRVGRRPKCSPFALSVSLKDAAGPKKATRDWEQQGVFDMTGLGWR